QLLGFFVLIPLQCLSLWAQIANLRYRCRHIKDVRVVCVDIALSKKRLKDSLSKALNITV
uniref:hypothetical protein n=1 Tax=Flavobacterium sp. ACAM 123 TaxID=1189620 RepID=UPI001E487BEE